MNFIDYCLYTKNYSALNAVKSYTKAFAFNMSMMNGRSFPQPQPKQQTPQSGAQSYKDRQQALIDEYIKIQRGQGLSVREPKTAADRKMMAQAMERIKNPKPQSNFNRLSVL